MNEHGIHIKTGRLFRTLIRPARVYAGGNETESWHLHYTNAIYSDDGEKTWADLANLFPVLKGPGEAAQLKSLPDGTLLINNSRRHISTAGQSPGGGKSN